MHAYANKKRPFFDDVFFRDLEKALKRLAQRRSVENKIIEERRRRTSLYRNKLYSETNSSLDSSAAGSVKNNEKLRIIKTMEGSPLMQQWRYMAQVDLDTAVSQVNTPSRWRSRVEYTPKYILRYSHACSWQ